MSSSSSWIDLLQRNGLTPTKSSKAAALRVSESTPKALRSQTKLSQLKEELVSLREEKRRQSELLERLTSDNSRLISQVEKSKVTNQKLEQELSEERLEHDRVKASLEMAQLTATELEKSMEEKDKSMDSLLSHVQSLQDEVRQMSGIYHQHKDNQPLVSDLERLTVHNAELCERLAATQHSRTALEREVLTLKRKLLEEKTVNGRLDQLLLSSDREKATMKDQLAQLTALQADNALTNIEMINKEKEELNTRLKKSQDQLDAVRLELDQIRENQIQEIEERCREVDMLKAQLEGEVTTLQQDALRNKEELKEVREQLVKGQSLNDQLTSERKAFQQRMDQMTKQVESGENARTKLHHQLENMSLDLEASLADLEANKISNLLLKQQVGDLESQLEASKEQLKSRLELSNEMKALLDQRATRIRQLESTLSKKREELDVSMETVSELLNASRESEELEAVDRISVSSSVMSSPAHRVNSRTRFTSTQAEVVHLKQRLSDSRQSVVRLEMKVAQVKTENAKLLGSQQALNSIKEQLSQENSRLALREREMDSQWQKERERLTNEINSMTAEAQELKRQLHLQREEMMVRMGELEMENQALALNELSSESQCRLEHVDKELSQLTLLLTDQKRWFHKQFKLYDKEMTGLKSEVLEVEERSKLTEAVNTATQSQLQVCESSVCKLIGEVEILRARKTVVMKYAHQQLSPPSPSLELLTQHNRQLKGEVEELRSALQQCLCGSVSHDQSCDQSQVSERSLKWRLRCQTRQTNYCRVKLGYALSELRLYKELKAAMDSHVAELQASIDDLKGRYHHCLEKLQVAEALGFTTNT